jgi:hypothetical protein
MFRLRFAVLVLSLAVVACGRDSRPKAPEFGEVLPNVPLPPDPTFVSRVGGTDAIQITLKTPSGPDEVAAYYREVFKKAPWRLVNDAKDRQGGVVFFAEQDGPPIWVHIRGGGEGGGSLVDIAGARVTKTPESTKPPAEPPAKPAS